ncbi:MAG: hypothetical protein U0T32_12060 [Chitinophagales bacterium]
MKTFKEFNIKIENKGLDGEKIKVKKILNKEIVVTDFQVKDSKFNGKCLHLQLESENNKHVLFTGSKVLLEAIEKVPKEGFPFKTTIVMDGDRLMFS